MIGSTEIGHIKKAAVGGLSTPALLLALAGGGGLIGAGAAGKGRRLKGALTGAAGGVLGGAMGSGLRGILDDVLRGSVITPERALMGGGAAGGLAGGLYMQPQVTGLNHLQSLGFDPEMDAGPERRIIADEILAQYM